MIRNLLTLTTKPRIKASGLLLACAMLPAWAQKTAPKTVLRPLSAAEVRVAQAGLDRSLLPEGAGKLQVAGGQAFRAQVAGRTEVTLLPVQFTFEEPGLVAGIEREMKACGVYLLDEAGKSRFVRVTGNANEGLIQCGGVEAVGLAQSTGRHADILLIFRSFTVHRSWGDPYRVSWSEGDGRYGVEPVAAPAWAGPADKLTISQLRRWIGDGPGKKGR